MKDSKQLNDKDLNKVSGGDDFDDALRQAAEEKKQRDLEKQIEELENHRNQRKSNDLDDLTKNIIDLLKKLTNTSDNSDNK